MLLLLLLLLLTTILCRGCGRYTNRVIAAGTLTKLDGIVDRTGESVWVDLITIAEGGELLVVMVA